MNEWCRSLAKRNNGCPALDWKEIKSTPNRPVTTIAHALEVQPSKMINRNVDFENASAVRTLKNNFGRRLLPASGTTQCANNPHNLALDSHLLNFDQTGFKNFIAPRRQGAKKNCLFSFLRTWRALRPFGWAQDMLCAIIVCLIL
jgi:hypothetical protein